MVSTINVYKAAAQNCILLACSPKCLPKLLSIFLNYCGPISHSFYWPSKNSHGVKGTLLIETVSSEGLRRGLDKIPHFPRPIFYANKEDKLRQSIVKLPHFRICSDPSLWPFEFESSHGLASQDFYDKASCIQANLTIQPALISSKKLKIELSSCLSIDEQASKLWSVSRLSYPSTLSRFILSDCIEEILIHLRPETRVSVFGSAVDGLGSASSDLDLVIDLGSHPNPDLSPDPRINSSHVKLERNISPNLLISALASSNNVVKPIFLSLLRQLLMRLDPLGFQYSRIYHGNVPILHINKFNLLGVGLDISRIVDGESGKNRYIHDGCQMAELLLLFAQCVPEFQKCVIVLKFIARKTQLTCEGPHPGLTNFKLMMLFIHFLQTSAYAPPLDYLIRSMNSGSTGSIPSLPDLKPITSVDLIMDQFFAYIPSLQPAFFALNLSSGQLVPRNPISPIQSASNEAQTHPKSIETLPYSNDFVLCPNPIHPTQNMLRGVTEDVWSDLVNFCLVTRQTLATHRNPSSNTLHRWGLLALKPITCTQTGGPENFSRPESFYDDSPLVSCV